MQHIASNTAPPGTEDTSRGTEGGVGTGAESGGVSSSSFVSPLRPDGSGAQHTSSQSGGMMDTVKSYLGMGSTGGNASETGQLGTTTEGRNVEDTTCGSGSGAGVTGAAASAASATGLGSGNSAAGGGLGSTSSDAATDSNKDSTSGSTLEAAKEKVESATGSAEKKESTSGDDDHKPPQPASGKPHKLENESAIPTAGGERLGEKHWGESGMVPDMPEPRASEAGVSSTEGQPTRESTTMGGCGRGTVTPY